MNKDILTQMGMLTELKRIQNNQCPICNKAVKIEDFRTELDLREWKISRICQDCIDEVFEE